MFLSKFYYGVMCPFVQKCYGQSQKKFCIFSNESMNVLLCCMNSMIWFFSKTRGILSRHFVFPHHASIAFFYSIFLNPNSSTSRKSYYPHSIWYEIFMCSHQLQCKITLNFTSKRENVISNMMKTTRLSTSENCY